MKIMLLTYMDNLGAGNAAVKIYKMLKKNEITVDLYTKKKATSFSKKFKLNDFNSIGHEFIYDSLNYVSNKLLNHKFVSKNYRSLGWFQSPYLKKINNSEFDIIQLNWINNFISIKDIGKISKPLIWRFSDMWPILGAKHYVTSNDQKLLELSVFDRFIEKINLKKKKINWKNKINIVTPSKWLSEKVKKSDLMSEWPINVIHTPIDTNTFKPLDRNKVRYQYKMNGKRVLLFGADNIFDKRKGLSILLDTFKRNLINDNNEYYLLTFGRGKIKESKINNLNIINFGYLKNNMKLNELFNLADVLILPSEIDNLPQIGLEAQTSGLPIITFKNSGLQELIDENKTGFFCELESSINLGNTISSFFLQARNFDNMRNNCRNRSLNLWSEEVVFKKYFTLYSDILDKKIKF